jgi:hypothetical protein
VSVELTIGNLSGGLLGIKLFVPSSGNAQRVILLQLNSALRMPPHTRGAVRSYSCEEIGLADAPAPTVRDIGRALTVGQLWAIAVAFVALIGGVFAFGVFVQSVRGSGDAFAKDERIHQLTTELSGKERQNGDLQRAVDGLTNQFKMVLDARDALDTKAEFLNRLVSYLQAGDDTSKKLLVDVVCSMWKESQKRRIRLVREPVNVSLESMRRGLPPDVEELMVARGGASREMLQRIRRNDFPTEAARVGPVTVQRPLAVNPSNNRDQAAATIQKHAQGIEVLKIVSFPDSTNYQMPQEIAAAVHMKNECAPL